MATFTHEGVTLAYDDFGDPAARDTVVLVHGYASNRREGWRRTGWCAAFEARGARVLALDLRGHGESGKPHEPEAYALPNLAGDLLALLDHLQLGPVDLVGYSMGSRISLAAAEQAPERVSRLVLGGVGSAWLRPPGDPEREAAQRQALAEAMLTDDPQAIEQPTLRGFRYFVDQQGEDPKAMAACALSLSPPPSVESLARVDLPVLVVAGARDRLAGEPEGLARAVPNGRAVTVAGCEHFSAIPHALTKAAVFDFLDGLLEAESDPFARSF
jgi:pimeloyl-ACP methyl ester carboxylesterase